MHHTSVHHKLGARFNAKVPLLKICVRQTRCAVSSPAVHVLWLGMRLNSQHAARNVELGALQQCNTTPCSMLLWLCRCPNGSLLLLQLRCLLLYVTIRHTAWNMPRAMWQTWRTLCLRL
jgi:hypothetical protein